MNLKFPLQARNILRAANKLGVKMKKGDPKTCAIGVLARSHGLATWLETNDIAEILNIPEKDLNGLEYGFESWEFDEYKHNPVYYKVGQNLRKKVLTKS